MWDQKDESKIDDSSPFAPSFSEDKYKSITDDPGSATFGEILEKYRKKE